MQNGSFTFWNYVKNKSCSKARICTLVEDKALFEKDEGFIIKCVITSDTYWCYDIVDKNLGNSVSNFSKCNLKVLSSQRRQWSSWNVSYKCVSNISDQKSMFATSYAVLFALQACSPQVDLYEDFHNYALREKNRQWLQRNMRYGIWVSRLHIFGPSKIITDNT